MPTTVEIQAFTFQELTQEAKALVITRLEPDYKWWDYIYDNAIEEGATKGFRIDDIRFSGFYSQGDGAAWEGRVDMVKWLELNKPNDINAIILLELIADEWMDSKLDIVRKDSRYAHSNTMNHGGCCLYYAPESTVSKGILAGANVGELICTIGAGVVDDVCVEILAEARAFAEEIYRRLRDEYEYLCSEEAIAERCDANEYLFTENGVLI